MSSIGLALIGSCGELHSEWETEQEEQLASAAPADPAVGGDLLLDVLLRLDLLTHGFTGNVEATLPARLRRPVNPELAELGKKLFFDKISAFRSDNSCAGCHAPSHGLGDSQSIAIGVQNNDVVGPGRAGPRNQRRTPSVINTAFYPRLMWNGRFAAPSGDPFNNSGGFSFPAPEGNTMFPPFDPSVRHLLVAQAHLPATELVETAGFTGTRGTISPELDAFDDGVGPSVPAPDGSGFRNEPLRQVLLARLNGNAGYRAAFARQYPSVASGGAIDYRMVGQAIAEFEFTLVFANAPIDRFARGNGLAMTRGQKRGALLFFGKGKCVQCHAVAGGANEMFSDFGNHVVAVPQIAPFFGVGTGNVIFDGPGRDEDFGLEQVTGDAADRYKFRTSPLRNVSLQPAFFHNGAYTSLRDAIAHHLNPAQAARGYQPVAAGVDDDLCHRLGPTAPVLARLDALLAQPVALTAAELDDLVEFVRDGLLDPRAGKAAMCALVPSALPSGLPLQSFQGCAP